jgi:hypothetical protein
MRPGFLSILVASLLSCFGASAVRADAPVVENSDHGLWDEVPRRNFQILENLVLGSEDGDDAFGRIADIAVDSRGRWIILDAGFCRVQVYDPDEMTMKTIGRQGEGPGEFTAPSAIGVDASDDIYVAGQGGHIVGFAPDGEPIDAFRHKFQGGGMITRIRMTPTATYLACFDPTTKTMVHRYDGKHAYVSSFSASLSAVKEMASDVALASCSGSIDVDADSNVLYTQIMPYEIRKFSPDGTLLLTIHRQNDFMFPPTFERNTIRGYGGSTAVLALPGGRIMNVAVVVPRDNGARRVTYLDLFDADGRLLKTRRLEGGIQLRYRDAAGSVYAIVTKNYPQMARYRLEMP